MVKKRRKRRLTTRTKGLKEPLSKKEERKKFPKELIKAYLAVRENWENNKLYSRYKKEAEKYYGRKPDALDSGRLIVLLHVATVDLHNEKKEKNTKETKET